MLLALQLNHGGAAVIRTGSLAFAIAFEVYLWLSWKGSARRAWPTQASYVLAGLLVAAVHSWVLLFLRVFQISCWCRFPKSF